MLLLKCHWMGIHSFSGRMARSHAVAIGLLVTLAMSGCNQSNRAEVYGLVTLDGKPIEQGSISFYPTGENKGPSAGAAIADGRYTIMSAKGVAIGANRVSISSVQATGRKIPSVDIVYDERLEAVPPKYNSETTLTRDIQPGSNELNFELEGRLPIEQSRRRYPTKR